MDTAARIAPSVLARHSPSYVVPTDADRRQRIERFQARSARVADAWRSPDQKTAPSKVNDAGLSPGDKRTLRTASAMEKSVTLDQQVANAFSEPTSSAALSQLIAEVEGAAACAGAAGPAGQRSRPPADDII